MSLHQPGEAKEENVEGSSAYLLFCCLPGPDQDTQRSTPEIKAHA